MLFFSLQTHVRIRIIKPRSTHLCVFRKGTCVCDMGSEFTFGDYLRERRQEQGLSARELAIKADISAMYICDIEKHRRPAPTDELLERLAGALAISVRKNGRGFTIWQLNPRIRSALTCRTISWRRTSFVPRSAPQRNATPPTRSGKNHRAHPAQNSREGWNMKQPYIRQAMLEAIARRTLQQLGYSYLNAPPQAVPLEHLIEDIYKLCIEYKYLTTTGVCSARPYCDSGLTPYYDADKHQYDFLRVEREPCSSTRRCWPKQTRSPAFYRGARAGALDTPSGSICGHARACRAAVLRSDTAMEWQANTLATGILMPLGQISAATFLCLPAHSTRTNY